MKKIDQAGFGVIGMIAIALAVIVLGFAGWYVWDVNQDDKSPAPTETVTTTPSPTVSDAIKTIRFSEVPEELQQAILKKTEASSPECMKDGKIVGAQGEVTDQEVIYSEVGFAQTGIGCDGGAAFLFVKGAKEWTTIAATQGEYPCGPLKQYKVSVAFLSEAVPGSEAPTCYDAEQELSLEYTL
jgi:hypothetical protein